nr:hypothetical protein [Paucibacter sp. M5-1]MCZ7880163.1 hypothetical protein [Paucibacter sp. M5-1]
MLKITKRRLTQKAVAHSTHSGAPAAISGSEASCELPANTTRLISKAIQTDSPLLTMATPVTRPQAEMPSVMPIISRAPRRNSGSRVSAR